MTKKITSHEYSQCPGVPSLGQECVRRIRSRKLCPDCAKSAIAGKIVRNERRCPGVLAVGHSCTTRIRSRSRCRSCEAVFIKYQDHLDGLTKTKIERWCLKCDRKFIAKNRFLRLCDNCRSGNRSSEHNGLDETRYTISVGRGG